MTRASSGALGAEVPYDSNFRETVTRGVHLLMVHVSDSSLRADAQRLLDRFGGVERSNSSFLQACESGNRICALSYRVQQQEITSGQ